MIKQLLSAAALTCTMTWASTSFAATELITNGDFETGDTTGWSCAISGDAKCQPDTGFESPTSGIWYLELFDNDGLGSVTQTINTVLGQTYNFSFNSSASSNAISPGNLLSYSLDGGASVLTTLTNLMTQTTDSFVASGNTADITFFFQTRPGDGIIGIDDVSVKAAAIPLPATAPLLAMALGGLWFGRRKRS